MFEEKCSTRAKKEVEAMEAEVRAKWKMTLGDRIPEEVRGWVENPIHSWNWDIKYFKIIETYWLLKMMVAQALDKNKEEQQEILHTIQIFEGKCDAMSWTDFGIKIIISKMTKKWR